MFKNKTKKLGLMLFLALLTIILGTISKGEESKWRRVSPPIAPLAPVKLTLIDIVKIIVNIS